MALSQKQVATLLGLKKHRAGESLGNRGEARLRMVGAATGPRMVATAWENRREALRLPVSQTAWAESAFLRPGLEARLVDIAQGGALLEVPARVNLNARVELHLTAVDGSLKLAVPCSIRRCVVAGLGPLRFHAAVAFDADLDELAESGTAPAAAAS
jgi:hypothetical protein